MTNVKAVLRVLPAIVTIVSCLCSVIFILGVVSAGYQQVGDCLEINLPLGLGTVPLCRTAPNVAPLSPVVESTLAGPTVEVQAPTLENTPTPLPTLTPEFTATPVVIPTITPNYTVLLQDDFELGVGSQWQSEGNWLMTNGRLTPAEIKDSKIYSVDTSWVNYEGEITFEGTEDFYLFVIMRFQNSDNFAEFVMQCGWDRNYFSLNTSDYMLWRIRKNGNTSEIQGTRTETSCRNQKGVITFSVVDNVYRATFNGNTISFADPDYALTSGGIGLRFYPFDDTDTGALVQFDEIIIKSK